MAASAAAAGSSGAAGDDGASEEAKPVLTFGVVTDVQYADHDDGSDFKKTRIRRFRAAEGGLRRAMAAFQKDADVAFVAQLGDLWDGRGKDVAEDSWNKRLGPAFSDHGFVAGAPEGTRDVHHCIGNHELYCFDREKLNALLFTRRGKGEVEYYSFHPVTGWRFVVLDPFEISCLNGADKPETEEAFRMLESKNPNDVRGAADWLAGLSGPARRFVPYNGALSDAQLAWLKGEFEAAVAAGERVVILSHVNFCPGASADETLLWNYEAVLALVHAQPRGTVAAALYGHDHDGGYTTDDHGIHHATFQAILETPDDAYATLACFDDRIEVRGVGTVPSATWALPPLAGAGPTKTG